MQYTLLIYVNAQERETRERREDPRPAWKAYTQALQDAGIFVGDAGLHGTMAATTLRIIDGKRQVQDGPYADTKEELGGLYIIEVANLDDALAWAWKIPAPPGSVIEIRPNLSIDG